MRPSVKDETKWNVKSKESLKLLILFLFCFLDEIYTILLCWYTVHGLYILPHLPDFTGKDNTNKIRKATKSKKKVASSHESWCKDKYNFYIPLCRHWLFLNAKIKSETSLLPYYGVVKKRKDRQLIHHPDVVTAKRTKRIEIWKKRLLLLSPYWFALA